MIQAVQRQRLLINAVQIPGGVALLLLRQLPPPRCSGLLLCSPGIGHKVASAPLPRRLWHRIRMQPLRLRVACDDKIGIPLYVINCAREGR